MAVIWKVTEVKSWIWHLFTNQNHKKYETHYPKPYNPFGPLFEDKVTGLQNEQA